MATLLLGRCNPYGAETGGPKRVLGGLYGPRSAETPEMNLPDSVAQGEWPCTQPAQVRCRAVCRCGHKGQLMQLCSWHDDDTWTSELVAGEFRRVHGTVRARGHYEEFLSRQAGFCPPCAWPAPYAELQKEIQGWQAEMHRLYVLAKWDSPRVRQLQTMVEDAGKMMDLARFQGIIHNCPLTLVAVS